MTKTSGVDKVPNKRSQLIQLAILKRNSESWLKKTDDEEELKRINNWVALVTKRLEEERKKKK